MACCLIYSCEKDNLDGPDATLAGELRDIDTDELVPQEILDGSRVYFIEKGWGDNPLVQNTVIKRDGTFYNGLIFSGDYDIIMDKGNYVPLDTLSVELKPGNNFYVFHVQPYIRVINPNIFLDGDRIIARFSIEQTTNNYVNRISLFAHSHIDVSQRLNVVNQSVDLNRLVDKNEVFELSINLSDYQSILKPGNSYYFRIGAVSTASEAKYNYSTAVQISI